MHSFLDLAAARYSVRMFSDRKVGKEDIDMILEAARLAPTATNGQPQRILVLDAPQKLADLKECTRFHFDAPLAFIVCYDATASWKRTYDGKDMGEVDAAIVTTHMMLEIADRGLGTTWVGHFNPMKLREIFSLPEHIIPVAVLPVGYPHARSVPNPRHGERLPRGQTVFFNEF